MSTLLIDMGNNFLKWGITTHDGDLSQFHSFPVAAMSEKSWAGCEKPDSIYVSSVSTTDHKQNLIRHLESKWQITPEFITSPVAGLGITNAYSDASRLGSDRWAAMVAAFHVTQSAVLVVDAGTALTIDAIDDQGQHLGGLIFPGMNLSRNLLASGTQIDFDLKDIPSRHSEFFGNSTEKGIISGTLQASGSLIDRAYGELTAINKKVEPVCYLTGGDAEQIKDTLQCSYVFEPALVLKGLALIAAAP